MDGVLDRLFRHDACMTWLQSERNMHQQVTNNNSRNAEERTVANNSVKSACMEGTVVLAVVACKQKNEGTKKIKSSRVGNIFPAPADRR
jgi:hypothetical protein